MRHYICILVACLALSSCFKDEPLNSECDITSAEVILDDWSKTFYNETDTRANITGDYSSSTIRFTNVLPGADLTAMAPIFTISEGATINPASGTIRDFSQGGQTYVVTSANGKWTREYTVHFVYPQPETAWSFDTYTLNESSQYYVWGGDWATANPGFSVANGGTDPEGYPTVPDPNGVKGACVKLTTTSTGVWGTLVKKPLAAGNLFFGDFDLSKALTNTLQSTLFGIPYNLKPVRFRGYYKFSPGSQITDENGNNVDGEDRPAVDARLYRNHDEKGNEIVLTGEDIKDSPYIIGNAEVDPQVTTEWIYFDIPFDYWEECDMNTLERMGYSLTIVFSSSKEGAQYEGAIGSTLYIDEISIVVENDETNDNPQQ